jgi:hypothetical protein
MRGCVARMETASNENMRGEDNLEDLLVDEDNIKMDKN